MKPAQHFIPLFTPRPELVVDDTAGIFISLVAKTLNSTRDFQHPNLRLRLRHSLRHSFSSLYIGIDIEMGRDIFDF